MINFVIFHFYCSFRKRPYFTKRKPKLSSIEILIEVARLKTKIRGEIKCSPQTYEKTSRILHEL